MNNEHQNIRYMLTFSEEQLAFLNARRNKNAVKTLFYIISKAIKHPAMQKNEVNNQTAEKSETKLSTGKCRMNAYELMELLACGKSAATNIFKKLNAAGFIKSCYKHPVYIHSVLCLNGWSKDGIYAINPESANHHYLI